ncbi:porin family protein [Neolewinella antarctica]|uniref:Outer membrane protein beta-barrel domain-containing protein n=1 Tax=Neolewinella antarctica TaxID=442734 RepID=A0ABX0XDH3_9BACT|nr:hypothetical protein [Neolewinella antarctica]NJC27262.1 hypothetical protein [Neolewinella antarctica]
MLRTLPLLFVVFCLSMVYGSPLAAQDYGEYGEYKVDWGGYLFGVKGGPGLGNQDWTGIETEFVTGFHGALFLESIPTGGRFSFYGQLGYHTRGSKISRQRAFTFSGNRVTLPADDFRFQNISLGVGAKSVVARTGFTDLYYLLGVRVEYSVSNNLGEYDQLANTFGNSFRSNYPFDSPNFINEITYGATFGGGALFPVSDKVAGFIELTAHPDLNFQYNQAPIDNVIDPFGGGTRTIGERMIRNFTIELSVGIRFLRKWDYLD